MILIAAIVTIVIVAVQPSNARSRSYVEPSLRDWDSDHGNYIQNYQRLRNVIEEKDEDTDLFEQLRYLMEKRQAATTLIDKKPCIEIRRGSTMSGAEPAPAKQVTFVRDCMAYCDSIPNCVAWDFYYGNPTGTGSCQPKGPGKPTTGSNTAYLSGYCDSSQALIDKKPCIEIRQGSTMDGAEPAPAKVVANVSECMAYCDSITNCVAWDFSNRNPAGIGACQPKGPGKPITGSNTAYLSGYCDSSQAPIDKKPCVEIRQGSYMTGAEPVPAKQVANVKECMAYCDSIPTCVAWQYYNSNRNEQGSCQPKGHVKPTTGSNASYISGYCDSKQALIDKKPCIEIRQSSYMSGAEPVLPKQVANVSECMAYCDSVPNCVAWDFYNGNPGGSGSCQPKGPCKPSINYDAAYLSGYCDST